jgi:hypothetical protein
MGHTYKNHCHKLKWDDTISSVIMIRDYDKLLGIVLNLQI